MLRDQANQGGILGFMQLFSGGALTQFAVFALGIMPYITASIIMQILGVVIPRIEQWQQHGCGRSAQDHAVDHALPDRSMHRGACSRPRSPSCSTTVAVASVVTPPTATSLDLLPKFNAWTVWRSSSSPSPPARRC